MTYNPYKNCVELTSGNTADSGNCTNTLFGDRLFLVKADAVTDVIINPCSAASQKLHITAMAENTAVSPTLQFYAVETAELDGISLKSSEESTFDGKVKGGGSFTVTVRKDSEAQRCFDAQLKVKGKFIPVTLSCGKAEAHFAASISCSGSNSSYGGITLTKVEKERGTTELFVRYTFSVPENNTIKSHFLANQYQATVLIPANIID